MKVSFNTITLFFLVNVIIATAIVAASLIKESKFDLYFTEQEAIQSFDLILNDIQKRENEEMEKQEKELEKNSNSNNKGGEESASDKKTKQQKLQVLTPEEKKIWKNEYCKMDIIASIGKGRWLLSEKLIKACLSNGFKVSSPIYKASGYIRKKLTEMQNLMSFKPEKTLKAISPALQWGQSADYLFINVKFAHKMDTPATLGVKTENVTITSHGLYLSAFSKTKNKRFSLNLEFPREIIPDESTWSMGSVGRATFELKKRWPQTKWARFTTSTTVAPNMHIWWAMKEQYSGELGTLEEYVTDKKAKKMYEEELEKAKKQEEETKTKMKEEKEKAIENGAVKGSDVVQEEIVNANGEVETVTAEDIVNNDNNDNNDNNNNGEGEKKKKKKKKKKRKKKKKKKKNKKTVD